MLRFSIVEIVSVMHVVDHWDDGLRRLEAWHIHPQSCRWIACLKVISLAVLMIMWYQLTSPLPPTTQLQYCIWAKSCKNVHEIGQLGGDDEMMSSLSSLLLSLPGRRAKRQGEGGWYSARPFRRPGGREAVGREDSVFSMESSCSAAGCRPRPGQSGERSRRLVKER